MEQRDSCWIGVDLGGTNLRIGAVGGDGEILSFEKIRSSLLLEGDGPSDRLAEIIRTFIREKCAGMKVEGAAVGIPGTLNKARTEVQQVPNIAGLDHMKASFLEEKLGVKVILMRDVCAILSYDRKAYALPSCEVLLGIYVGTGIGNVIFVNGRELTGKNGAAGELGHIPVIGDETPCGCGNTGCSESIAGGKYLAGLCRTVFQDVPIGELFSKKGSHPLISEYLDRLACIIATEINIFDPDYLMLGGGVPAMKDFPADELLERIRIHARKPFPAQGLQIILTEDREEKGVIGAVLYARSVAE